MHSCWTRRATCPLRSACATYPPSFRRHLFLTIHFCRRASPTLSWIPAASTQCVRVQFHPSLSTRFISIKDFRNFDNFYTLWITHRFLALPICAARYAFLHIYFQLLSQPHGTVSIFIYRTLRIVPWWVSGWSLLTTFGQAAEEKSSILTGGLDRTDLPLTMKKGMDLRASIG